MLNFLFKKKNEEDEAPQQQQQQQQQSFSQCKKKKHKKRTPLKSDGAMGERMPTSEYHSDKTSSKIPEGMEIAAVIVSFTSETSYDALFEEHPPKPPNPNVALSLFRFPLKAVDFFLNFLESGEVPDDQPVLKEALDDIRVVAPESVLFNFECCAGCDSGNVNIKLTHFLSTIMKRNHTAMFGDFSLKWLIREWKKDSSKLGEPLFKEVGVTSGNVRLKFDPEELKKCDFAQLSAVGHICDGGEAIISTMASTILFSYNDEKTISNTLFDTEVFSSAALPSVNMYQQQQQQMQTVNMYQQQQQMQIPQQSNLMNISVPSTEEASKDEAETSKDSDDEKKSSLLGHVVLTWKGERDENEDGDEEEDGDKVLGGKIVVSMGHWVELTRLETSVDSALRWAERVGGEEERQRLQVQLSNAKGKKKKSAMLQAYCQTSVQSTSNVIYKQKKSSKRKGMKYSKRVDVEEE